MSKNAQPPTPSICRLCDKLSILRKSHIFSEFLYDKTYHEPHSTWVIHDKSSSVDVRQKGITQPLLCQDCETLLCHHFETPFARIYRSNLWESATHCFEFPPWALRRAAGIDYKVFKLFILSLLWRASHMDEAFSIKPAELGPHRDQMKAMLKSRDPGPEWKYPIWVSHVTLEAEPADMIWFPTRNRHGAMSFQEFLIPNFTIRIGVAADAIMKRTNHRYNLKEDGSFHILSHPLESSPVFEDFQKLILSVREPPVSKGKRH